MDQQQIKQTVTTIKPPIARKLLILGSALAGLAVAGVLSVVKTGSVVVEETVVDIEPDTTD